MDKLEKFLEDIKVDYKITFIENRKIDKYHHDVYTLSLNRGILKYSFEFFQYTFESLKYKDKSFSDRFYTPGGIALGNYKSISEKAVRDICFLKGYRTVPKVGDIFECLTLHSPGMFEDFCGEFGYDSNLISYLETYKKIAEEYLKISYFFSNQELEELNNILSNQD